MYLASQLPTSPHNLVAGSHIIEHFDLNAGLRLMGEAHRVLKPGGVVRLSCPDLELYAKNYLSGNKDFFNNPKIREWCTFKQAETFGEIFAAKAYDNSGTHKWFYDFDSLKHILAKNGFGNIRKVGRLEGKTPDVEKIELSDRELETIYIEAEK
jgi:predicted SAM-dependent methyltransferase